MPKPLKKYGTTILSVEFTVKASSKPKAMIEFYNKGVVVNCPSIYQMPDEVRPSEIRKKKSFNR